MNILGTTGAIILSMAPVFEVRGAIPFAVKFGLGIWTAFFICLIANIILIPLVFLFLDYVHIHLMNVFLYSRMFNLYLSRVRRKSEEKIHGAWPYVALFGFVALPIPGTGVWTGVLVSWFFKMSRKKSFVALMFGSIAVSLIVTLVTIGAVSLW